MAVFSYEYIDKNGKLKKGQMEANEEKQVLDLLRQDGVTPVTVGELNMLNKDISLNIGNYASARDLSIFCRQIVTIISSGTSVVNALYMLGEQTQNKRLKQAIISTQILVEKGETLSSAMAQQKKVYPSILNHMVEAGEATGSLENSFERMATHFEKTSKTKALIKKAMIYPIAISIVAVAVIILMLAVIIPMYSDMFASMDVKMPAITVAMMNASDFIVHKWYILVAIIAGFIALVISFRKSEKGKLFFSKASLKLPLVKGIVIKSASASLCRTISTLLGSGITMVEAIDITGKTMKNEVIKKVLMDAKEDVMRGVSFSSQLESSGVFPPMVYHMTKIGEETGNVENMLSKIADYYEEEVEISTQSMMAILEPVIIVLMAIIVAVMIISIIQPMLTMYDGLDSMM